MGPSKGKGEEGVSELEKEMDGRSSGEAMAGFEDGRGAQAKECRQPVGLDKGRKQTLS